MILAPTFSAHLVAVRLGGTSQRDASRGGGGQAETPPPPPLASRGSASRRDASRGHQARVLGPAWVRPATVEEAVGVLEYGPAVLTLGGDTGAYALAGFRAALSSWFPPSLASGLLALWTPPAEAVRIAMEHLSIGCPETPERSRQDWEKARRDKALREYDGSWSSSIARYRAAYGASPLGEPWPFFLHQLDMVSRVEAQRVLDAIQAYRLGRHPVEDEEERLLVRSGFKPKSEEEKAEEQQDAFRRLHSLGGTAAYAARQRAEEDTN